MQALNISLKKQPKLSQLVGRSTDSSIIRIQLRSWIVSKKVHEKFDMGATWDGAMDEIRAERWEKRYKERTLEVMIKYWPDTDKYKNRPELITSLENQVNW